MGAVKMLIDSRGLTRTAPTGVVPAMPYLAILTAVVLWGGSFVAMRIAVDRLSPLSVMWIRMMTATLLVLPFIGRLKPTGYRQGDWKRLMLMAAFQPCFYFLLESYALRNTTASQAGVVAATAPMLVGVGAFWLLNEAITRRMVMGLILSVAGVVGLTIAGRGDEAASNPVLGNLMEFGAMICAAGNLLIVKRLSRRYNTWTLTAIQMMTGAIFFLPGLPLLFTTPGLVWTFDLVVSLTFLGVLVTLGAFGLYNWGMSHIPASQASVFINLVPVVAVVLAWGILGEALNWFQCCAAVTVLIGVWISQNSAKLVSS